MKKKFLALLISVAMTVVVIPTYAFATADGLEGTDNIKEAVQENKKMRRSNYICMLFVSAGTAGTSVMWAHTRETSMYCLRNFLSVAMCGVIFTILAYIADRIKTAAKKKGKGAVGVLTIFHIINASFVALWGFALNKLTYMPDSDRISVSHYFTIAIALIILYGIAMYIYEKRKSLKAIND